MLLGVNDLWTVSVRCPDFTTPSLETGASQNCHLDVWWYFHNKKIDFFSVTPGEANL